MKYHIIWHLVVQDPWLTKCLVSLLTSQLEFHFPSVLKSITLSITGYVLWLYSSLSIRTYNCNAVRVDIDMKWEGLFKLKMEIVQKAFQWLYNLCFYVMVPQEVLCCKAVILYCIVLLYSLRIIVWQYLLCCHGNQYKAHIWGSHLVSIAAKKSL